MSNFDPHPRRFYIASDPAPAPAPTTQPLTQGDPVRFKVGALGRLGLLASPDADLFELETVGPDDVGTYEGAHPTIPDWHMIRVQVGERELFCPCHPCQFEAVTS